MNNKVYIVTSYDKGEGWPKIEAVCLSSEAAAKKKLQIDEKIKALKEEYKSTYGKTIEEDYQSYMGCSKWIEDEEDNWDEIADRFILFEVKHPELKINSIGITEWEVE